MTTNALELVPAFRRQIGVYAQGTTYTDSYLAGYIADAVQALMFRWGREYEVTFISPETYIIEPEIEQKDIRPIILMASIIYKMGTIGLAAFTDGDFSYNPHRGESSAAEMDRKELLGYIPAIQLARPSVGQFLGFNNWFSPESYVWAAINYL